MEHEIIIEMSGQELGRIKASVVRPYNRILICPNCFRAMHLGRYSESEKWAYEHDDTVYDHTSPYKTEKGFTNHIRNCENPFVARINRIDHNCKRRTHYIADELAKWSQRETKWDIQQIIESDFQSDDVVAYIYYLNNVGPISYAAFRGKSFGNHFQGRHFILWDLYTFPSFRKRGFVTELITHGIQELGLSRNDFMISAPLTKASMNVIKNVTARHIVVCTGAGYEIVEKEEVERLIRL